MFPKSRNEIPPMSVEAATEYVRTMVQRESRGSATRRSAMRRSTSTDARIAVIGTSGASARKTEPPTKETEADA